MVDMTLNTIVFSGPHEEIEILDRIIGKELNFDSIIKSPPYFECWTKEKRHEWMENNWGSFWCQTSEKTRKNHNWGSMLKLAFETPYAPPLKVIDALYSMCPNVKSIHKLSVERNWYESTYVCRDPKRGFKTVLIDTNEFHLMDAPATLQVDEEFIEELMVDDELKIMSETIGVTLDWINSMRSEDKRELEYQDLMS